MQVLQEEVDKHAQITAMINNLTSGRMNVAKWMNGWMNDK